LVEKHYRDLQDIEFTVESGKLWMLQTRTGKRSAKAAVKIAVDMAREGLVTKQEAILRVEPMHVVQLLLPQFDERAKVGARKEGRYLTRGLNASPGAAAGFATFDPDEAESMGRDQKKPVILVRLEVWANADYPRDAERARQFGAQGIGLDRTEHMFMETDRLDIVHEMILAAPDYRRVSREMRALKSEIETAKDEKRDALSKRVALLEPVLGDLSRRYLGSLEKLGGLQKEDFIGILRAMQGLPVIIRLIDPPLHEFLPKYESLLVQVTKLTLARGNPDVLIHNAHSDEDKAFVEEVTKAGNGDVRRGIEVLLPGKQVLLEAVAANRESNPMLGLRGCRLGITFPEITEMQVRAIFEASCALTKEGVVVKPEIMIPLAGHVNELKIERDALEAEAKKVMEREG